MIRVPCRVCNKPYDGTTHCSVNACKACAVFFRRSETLDILPDCPTGKNECILDKAGKIKCSSCRFKKCIEVGMKSIKNQRTLKYDCEDHVLAPERTAEVSKTVFDVYMLVADPMPTIKRFSHFYACCMNNKTKKELELLHADGARLSQLPGNRQAGQITHSLSNRMMPFDIAEFGKFVNGSFPGFTELENSYQETLTYLLLFPLHELDSSFRSMRVFKDVNCKKVLCSEVLYADLADTSRFINPNMFSDPMDYRATMDYMSVWWNEFMNTTQRVMHRIQITDVEFLAVFALTIWNADNFEHNKLLSQIAEKHRCLLYKDLDYYYKNILHLDNYVERIMNFKELDRLIKKNSRGLRESFHFLRTFNFYSTSQALWNTAIKVIHAYESIEAQ